MTQQQLGFFLSKNETASLPSESPREWTLRCWVEFAVPAWRKVLQESIEARDKRREGYARDILENVLEAKGVN